MNIGFDGSRAFSKNRTGTENYSYQILKSLALIDQTNNYYIYLRPQVEIKKADWPDNFHFKVLNYRRLWTQVGLSRQTFIDRFLDVLFVPSHTLPLIRRPGLKTVMTVHDLGSEYLPQTHQLKQKLYLNFITNHQLKTADGLIAVSEATKQDLIKKTGVAKSKITVVHEGYDQATFKPVKNDLLVSSLNKYELKPKSYFLFVGTIQPRKNLDILIKAYAEAIKFLDNKPQNTTPETSKQSRISTNDRGSDLVRNNTPTLVLAGSRGWLSDEIYESPRQLGIDAKVNFLGYVPDSDLPALYAGAQAFLFPSLFEGFGLPVIEAQACGTPVLTSNVSSLPEVAGESTLLVDPYSKSEITQGILELMDEKERNRYIKLGFENIKRFSWEKAARETLRVLETT